MIKIKQKNKILIVGLIVLVSLLFFLIFKLKDSNNIFLGSCQSEWKQLYLNINLLIKLKRI